MLTRSQKDKDFILSNLEETYYIENFISIEDIETLSMEYYGNVNKVYKNFDTNLFIFSAYSLDI